MNPAQSTGPDRRHLLALLALAALTVAAFSNSFASGFILDNRGLLLDPRVHQATAENIALIFRHTYWWPTGEAGLYRPITTLSYLFNYAVLGDGEQPAGYHLINVLLHLANVWLAYALALRLIRKFWPAVFIAGLWAVHPALTESVTNIVGRADLMAGLAVLSGFLMYLKSTETSGTARSLWIGALALVTTIGVFSKESAVAIFPLIILYELVWWKERPPHRRAFVLGSLATLLPIAGLLFERFKVLAASAPAEFPFTDNPIAGAGWVTGRLTAIKVMAHYLWLTVWPVKLSCDYSYNQIPLFRGAAADWLACGAVLAVAIAVILLYRRDRTFFFLAGFAFLNFLPASNLPFPIGTIMADRLLYLPSLGLLGCLVLAVYAAAERSPRALLLAPALLCLVGIAFAVRTWARNLDWQSELTIATADVRVSPNSFKLHRLLAQSLFDSDPSHSNIDQVIAEIEKSLALLDSLPDASRPPDVYRLAGYYDLVKSRQPGARENAALYQEAIGDLRRSISIGRVADPQAYLLLSVAYLESGNPEPALQAAMRARALDPLNAQIYRQFSAIYYAQGNRPEAAAAAALEDSITASQRGKWQETAELSGQVLHYNAAEYPAAYYFNAMANLQLGNLEAAEKSAREAIRLDRDHRNPKSSYVLGLILAREQNFQQATEALNAYLREAPDAPDAETVRKQRDELRKLAGSR
jgi:protein O-mannosyl-transferase